MRSLLLSVLLLVTIQAIGQIPSNGLIAYYPFNGNVNDESGNGRNGTPMGSPSFVSGLQGTSLKLIGACTTGFCEGTAGDHALLPSIPFNTMSTFSINIWVKEIQMLFDHGESYIYYGNDQSGSIHISHFGGNITFSVSPGTAINVPFEVADLNVFVMYTLVYEAGILKAYKNGVLKGVANGPVQLTESNAAFGRHWWWSTSTRFSGLIDEVRIYDRVLCESEVVQIYNTQLPVSSIDLTNGLMAHYPLNGNANDISPNGNNCINNGAVGVTDRKGNSNSALEFKNGAYLDGGNSVPLSLQMTSEVSVSAWIKVDAVTDGGRIVRVGCNCGENTGYDFYTLPYGGGYQLGAIFGNAYVLTNQELNFGAWYQVVFTANGTSLDIYVNGIKVVTGPSWIIIPPTTNSYNGFPFYIGRKENDGYQDGVMDDIRIYNRTLNQAEIQLLSEGNFIYSCVQWTGIAPVLDIETATSFDYLCSNNIIQSSQTSSATTSTLRKDELAKILFRALNTPATEATTPVDDAPNPFLDLQSSVSAYVKEAKALSYLEYGDGVPVFKREFTHFRPQFPILRKHVIKAMLETFNIKPYTSANAPTPSCWYSDVPVTDEMYYYILKARDLGFIRQQSVFNPNTPITRKEAFLILYRIMKYFETTPKPVPAYSDYFIPSNIKPANFSRNFGVSDGNFNAYTKTSFAIAGLMPLTFAHSYNSAYTELPDSSYNIIEPLGKGWTHNYNCYLQRVSDDQDSTIRYVISWGDGTMNSFIKENGVFTPESKGVYSTLTADAGESSFIFKTKSQVRYEFSKFSLSTGTVWVLTSVKDRNNNSLQLTWTPYPVIGIPSSIRLFKVEDAVGRFMQFAYHATAPSKIDSIKAVTGSIIRSVRFSFINNYNDLESYINPKGDTTNYFYGDSLDFSKAHLLVQIKLPKGNIVDNTYENRKLKSTQMAGQYRTDINTQFNYSASNNTNYVESDISTYSGGGLMSTNIKQDQLGNVKAASSPSGNLNIDYEDPVHAFKPTFFSNTTNGLSASTNYDAMGNITSVTKNGATVALKDSFTYNIFNDISSYINARGYKTIFSYNGTGNLTGITDALGFETQMQVNPSGTVSRVTNPEGIFTDFTYDVYGNTQQSSLMGIITAEAVYDNASRLIRKIDPNGVETSMEYDINDAVKKVVVDPEGLKHTVSYHYDKNDNLDTIVNPKGYKTALKYNEFDQMVEYKFGAFNKTYVYNQDGTLNTFTDQKGNAFGYSYNPDGTLQYDGYAGYTYDQEKNLVGIQSLTNAKVISFEYDGLKRTRKVNYNDFASDSVVYEYDNNSNVISIKYPGGFRVGYDYDALDRLVRVYNKATNADFASYTYFKDGRLKTQINGNGTKTFYGYDGVGRLDSISNTTSGNTNIASYKFTMDNVGNHLSETNYEPSLPVMSVLPNEAIVYEHDSMNRMVSMGSTNFTYDANGNNTNATGLWSSDYTWDIKDNLLSSTSPALVCEYDALENRRRKNDTLYVLDILGGSNVLMETDASGNPLAYYIHGLGLIARLDASQSNPSYYHYDYRGSTVAITNSSQNTTHSYRYGPFGESWFISEGGFKNVFRYIGLYGVQYEDSSLYFMRARYYNSNLGRFLSEDPIWNSNLYNYVENNPVVWIDFTGLKLTGTQIERIRRARDNISRGLGSTGSTTNLTLKEKLLAAIPFDIKSSQEKNSQLYETFNRIRKNAGRITLVEVNFDEVIENLKDYKSGLSNENEVSEINSYLKKLEGYKSNYIDSDSFTDKNKAATKFIEEVSLSYGLSMNLVIKYCLK